MSTWVYGSTTLSTLGNITKLDDNFDMPNRRGNNIIIPYRHGTTHVAKYFEERTLVFGIAVLTANETALEAMFDTIATLFTTEQRLLVNTRADASVRQVYASVDKSLNVNRLDNRSARIVVEFKMATPFFVSNTLYTVTATMNGGTPDPLTVVNAGSVEQRDPTIVIDGPFSSVVITNPDGPILTYTGAIGASETVTISTAATGEYTAILSTGSVNVIGNVTHSGSSSLMPLKVGTTILSIAYAGGDGTGTVNVNFYPAFI